MNIDTAKYMMQNELPVYVIDKGTDGTQITIFKSTITSVVIEKEATYLIIDADEYDIDEVYQYYFHASQKMEELFGAKDELK